MAFRIGDTLWIKPELKLALFVNKKLLQSEKSTWFELCGKIYPYYMRYLQEEACNLGVINNYDLRVSLEQF